MSKSEQLFEKALKVLPGGVSRILFLESLTHFTLNKVKAVM